MSHRFVRRALALLIAGGLAAPAAAAPGARPAAGGKPVAGGKPGAPASGKPAAPSPGAPKAAKVDVDASAKALVGSDLEAAAAAATSLGDGETPAEHDVLLDALATGLEPRVAAAALAAMAKHPAPPDVAIALLYAAHRNDDARAAAVRALGAYPDPTAKKAVVAALGDDEEKVRAAAGDAIARGKIREGVDRLLALLDKGDAAAPAPLAALADADLAHAIGEHLGTAPAGALAETLGLVLKRADFPEAAKVQVVRALAKIPGAESTSALTDYVEATPDKPPRQSRKEAEQIVEARLSGGGQ